MFAAVAWFLVQEILRGADRVKLRLDTIGMELEPETFPLFVLVRHLKVF